MADTNETPATELRACPFCGSSTAPRMGAADECGYEGFGEHTVVCDFNNAGCGACSVFAESRSAAVKGWNRRAALRGTGAPLDVEAAAREIVNTISGDFEGEYEAVLAILERHGARP